MTKKIYSNNVKKWTIGAGVIGVPTVVLLIWVLVSSGAITVTGYSGDTICAGTIENPCVAYINFTANEDIFIYPNDTWKNTAFYTDIQPRDVKMYRSWGTGWREIDLTKKCTGTWCGLSNSKDKREFAFAFRENKSYEIKYAVLKNNTEDTIKWGFTKEVDPSFLGITKDNVFTKLISSKADLTYGEAIFEINNPIDNLSLSKALNFEFKGNTNNINSIEYFVMKNISSIQPIYVQKLVSKTCEETLNDTKVEIKDNARQEIIKYDCSYYETIEDGNETIYTITWEKVNKIPEGKNIIKMISHWDAELGEKKIDWIPTMTFDKSLGLDEDIILKQEQWAWWNASWNYRQLVTINYSNNVNLDKYWVNFSYSPPTGHFASDFSDLRLVNLDDNATLIWKWTQVNSSTIDIFAFAENSTQPVKNGTFQIYIYYNTTNPVDYGWNNTFYYGDTFTNRSTLNWTQGLGGQGPMTMDDTRDAALFNSANNSGGIFSSIYNPLPAEVSNWSSYTIYYNTTWGSVGSCTANDGSYSYAGLDNSSADPNPDTIVGVFTNGRTASYPDQNVANTYNNLAISTQMDIGGNFCNNWWIYGTVVQINNSNASSNTRIQTLQWLGTPTTGIDTRITTAYQTTNTPGLYWIVNARWAGNDAWLSSLLISKGNGTQIAYNVGEEETGEEPVSCNLTDVVNSIWSYSGGKFIDGFSDDICSTIPVNATYGQEIWNYNNGKFVDGIGSTTSTLDYNMVIDNCNLSDIAISMWCYNGPHEINGISSGENNIQTTNSTIGKYVWEWIYNNKYATSIVG